MHNADPTKAVFPLKKGQAKKIVEIYMAAAQAGEAERYLRALVNERLPKEIEEIGRATVLHHTNQLHEYWKHKLSELLKVKTNDLPDGPTKEATEELSNDPTIYEESDGTD